ncbi:MAG: hypothetical protein B6D35_10635 [Candidatus Brocadia sp. UTAMX2]|jgi:choline kinase|nr:MAG: hypothetical protein B6D35_10635 [Candidatus Brocadia sp. UTAMX2]
MGRYTKNIPKGMLVLKGRTLIEWQIKKLKSCGLKDIVIVTGYRNEAISYGGITYFHNNDFAKTNMVETLMCAREVLNTDILVSYSDIVYSEELAGMVMECPAEIGVAVDKSWRDYWMMRYGTTETDLETLNLSVDGRIIEIGRPVNTSEGIDYRYIGLIKFSDRGIARAIKLYDKKRAKNEPWKQSGKSFRQGFMTDLLYELIQEGTDVMPVITTGGWLEFDTEGDYEKALAMSEMGTISRFINW